MSELDQSDRPRPESPTSDLNTRVTALEAKVTELKTQGPGRLARLTVLLGVAATLLGLLSTVLSLKGSLFPAPHTAITDHGSLLMQYHPRSSGLTFNVAITVCNDGNRDDVLDAAEATLETAHGKLAAASLDLTDETEKAEKAPIIIRPGTAKMYLSPTFTYPLDEGGPAQLRIQFPEGRGKLVITKVCFSIGPRDLQQASEESDAGSYEISTSDCEPGRE